MNIFLKKGKKIKKVKLEERFNSIYDILVNIGGAVEQMRDPFVSIHVEEDCLEWRFCGHLGYGGKYRSDRNKVDCYSEDENEYRKDLIKKINNELSKV